MLEPTESRLKSQSLQKAVSEKFAATYGSRALIKRAEFVERREESRRDWKRDLTGRANGTIDPFYGCSLLDELIDYAVNFTFPWCEFLPQKVSYGFEDISLTTMQQTATLTSMTSPTPPAPSLS